MLRSPLCIINNTKYSLGQITNIKHAFFNDTKIITNKILPKITINKSQKLHYSIIQTVKLNNNKDI
eukprot:jgi/Orpsp1_1/1183470/evm.model.c7180000085328.1